MSQVSQLHARSQTGGSRLGEVTGPKLPSSGSATLQQPLLSTSPLSALCSPLLSPMPAPRTAPKPIKAEVRLLASSNPWRGSDSQTGIDWGFASPALWATLQNRQGQTSRTSLVDGHEDLEVFGIAVRWPRDRRLEDLERRDSTVLWVKRSDQVSSSGTNGYRQERYLMTH